MGNMGNSVLAAVAASLAPLRAAAATAYVQLVVATYDEDLSWIEPTLRTVPRSEAIVYCKGPVQPEARCTARLANWGTENYAYVHHVYKNYDNLAPITAFAMGSILKSEWQYLLCRKLFGVLGALSSVAKQDALRHFISPRGMHNHLVPFEPDFNISVYRPKRGLPPQINCPASAATNGAFYSKFAPNRSVGDALRHGSSLNGIAAAPRHVLRGVPRNAWGRLLDELSKKSCCEGAALQADHYAERLWRPLLLGTAAADASPQVPLAACPPFIFPLVPERLRHVDGDTRKAEEAWRRTGSPPPPPRSWRAACAPGWTPGGAPPHGSSRRGGHSAS